MLQAVKTGKRPEPAEKKAESPAPPLVLPRKPPVPPVRPKEEVPRRSVLLSLVATPFAAAWTFLTATTVTSLLALARFMFPNVLVEPPMKFKVGPPSDYPLNTVSTKWKASRGIWIVHTDTYKGRNLIYALLAVCTHLGCTPNWLEAEKKFKCPCHGSGFYMNGINFEGPAPRPLERVGIALAPDGQLEVDKSRRFQEELGQWEDPDSYVDASLV
ncbi:MAG: ubiquinol-cytochrome c reductase iron-sulfur subunit [Planctomycetota bacterium]|nr:MAG: ubiquinol-cytochrome c reductase iron-sulfur subunit [Planctomycetota bacterium]